MATYYVRTDGNNANAGTSDSSGGAWLTIEYAAAHATAGDTVYIRASAGNASSFPTSSPDYTISAYFTPTAGSASAGPLKFIGYNGMPTISSPGLSFYASVYCWLENLYFYASTNSNGSYGILSMSDNCVVKNCILNLNNQASLRGITLAQHGSVVAGNQIYGGTSSPSYSSGADGINNQTYGNQIHGNKIWKCRGHGIYLAGVSTGGPVLSNLIYANAGCGILNECGSVQTSDIIGNTIDGNLLHGVSITQTGGGVGGATWVCLRNNNITNHTQSSQYGINVVDGSASLNDKRNINWGYNNVYNNTGNYNNINAPSTDFSVNPSYANASTGDFTPSQSSLKAAFPTLF